MMLRPSVLLAVLVGLGCAAPPSGEPAAPAPALGEADLCPTCGRPPGEGTESAASDLAKASVGGKYRGLRKRLLVPEDRASYGDFNDWGYWSGTAWAGHTDLPAGYWVYVHPHWFIWEEAVGGATVHRRPPGALGSPEWRGFYR